MEVRNDVFVPITPAVFSVSSVHNRHRNLGKWLRVKACSKFCVYCCACHKTSFQQEFLFSELSLNRDPWIGVNILTLGAYWRRSWRGMWLTVNPGAGPGQSEASHTLPYPQNFLWPTILTARAVSRMQPWESNVLLRPSGHIQVTDPVYASV